MGKIKIHEIAKKLGVNSKEVLEKALELGLDVKFYLLTWNDAKKEDYIGTIEEWDKATDALEQALIEKG